MCLTLAVPSITIVSGMWPIPAGPSRVVFFLRVSLMVEMTMAETAPALLSATTAVESTQHLLKSLTDRNMS